MPPDRIDLSLNEVETLALKAARGAGLPWGVAEDVGCAAVWQARHVGRWAETLLHLLSLTPSPLLAVGLLADSTEPIDIDMVMAPSWLLPGVLAAPARPTAVRLGDARVHANPGAPATISVSIITIAEMQQASVGLAFPAAPLAALAHPIRPAFARSAISVTAWRRLDALAQLTYVPASDHSRRTGAGAGLLDDA